MSHRTTYLLCLLSIYECTSETDDIHVCRFHMETSFLDLERISFWSDQSKGQNSDFFLFLFWTNLIPAHNLEILLCSPKGGLNRCDDPSRSENERWHRHQAPASAGEREHRKRTKLWQKLPNSKSQLFFQIQLVTWPPLQCFSAQLRSLINHFSSSVTPHKTNCHCLLCFPPNCTGVKFDHDFLLPREESCLNKWRRGGSGSEWNSGTCVFMFKCETSQAAWRQTDWRPCLLWPKKRPSMSKGPHAGPNYPPLLTAARRDAWCGRLDEGFYCCSPSFQQPRCHHGLFIPPFREVDVLEQTCLKGATRCAKKFPPTLGFPDSSYRRRSASPPKLPSSLITAVILAGRLEAGESCRGDVLRSQQGSFYGLFPKLANIDP